MLTTNTLKGIAVATASSVGALTLATPADAGRRHRNLAAGALLGLGAAAIIAGSHRRNHMTMAIRQDIMHHRYNPIIMPHHLRHITAPPPTEAMHLRHGHRPGTGIARINIAHSMHGAVLTSLITGHANSADNTSSRGRETGRRITE